MIDHPSHPIQAEAETAALQLAAGFSGKKNKNWRSWLNNDDEDG